VYYPQVIILNRRYLLY